MKGLTEELSSNSFVTTWSSETYLTCFLHLLYLTSMMVLFRDWSWLQNSFRGKITALRKSNHRSSQQSCSIEKAFLKCLQISQENTCSRVLFFNKVAGLKPAVLLKKRLWSKFSPVNFAKFQKHLFYLWAKEDLVWKDKKFLDILESAVIWRYNST